MIHATAMMMIDHNTMMGMIRTIIFVDTSETEVLPKAIFAARWPFCSLMAILQPDGHFAAVIAVKKKKKKKKLLPMNQF
jgi:hypothetical protein